MLYRILWTYNLSKVAYVFDSVLMSMQSLTLYVPNVFVDAFYKHGSAWINYRTNYKVWDEFTYPFPNFNGAAIDVFEWIHHFISRCIMDVITHPCQDYSKSVLVIMARWNIRCSSILPNERRWPVYSAQSFLINWQWKVLSHQQPY